MKSDSNLARRAYRAALLAFPARIRDTHGDEMEEMFADAWRNARAAGVGSTVALITRTTRDMIVNGLGARYEEGVGMGMQMDGWWQDVGNAVRGLARRPGFALVAIVTLALGIGGNTAIYSIIDAAWVDPLPYPDANDLVVPYNTFDATRGTGFAAFSAPFHFAIRESGAYAGVASIGPNGSNIGGTDRPERVEGALVSGDFFEVIGIGPLLGRGLGMEDDRPGALPVAVLSHGLWLRRFAGDPSVVGSSLLVDDTPTTVVGVMPQGFDLFFDGVDIWSPYRTDPGAFDAAGAVNNNRMLVARRHAALSTEVEASRLGNAIEQMRQRFPDAVSETHGLTSVDLRHHLYGDARGSMVVLLGAVALVLLIASANLANLLMVRTEERRQELAVRAALGAPRGRLVRTLVLEALVLALFGAAAGVLTASAMLDLVRPLAPSGVPLPESLAMDPSVLLFTLVLACTTGILFGLLPAWSIARGDLRRPLLEGSRGAVSRGRSRARGVLVAGEVALTAVLLIGSGLLLGSLWRLQSAPLGFETADRTTFVIRLADGRYGTATESSLFYRELIDELNAVPGVESAGLAQFLPLAGASNWGYEVDGQDDDGVGFGDYNLVSPGYFDALGISVVEGRELTWADGDDAAEPVVLVSEAMARRLWPEGSAIGQRINVDLRGRVWRRVVGVVSDVRNRAMGREPGDLIYFPPTELPMANPRFMSLVVHHPGGAAPVSEVRRSVTGLDPSIPVTEARGMDDIARASEKSRRFLLTLLGAFAVLAIGLAAVGLYGVVSYTFSLRTREIGLRMAIGAGRRSVVGLVLAQSAILTGTGLVVGVAASTLLTRVMGSFLYDVGATDVVTYVSVAIFLALVSGLATWIPAARASAVDPADVLRG